MSARVPKGLRSVVMTIEASRVLLIGRLAGVGTETDYPAVTRAMHYFVGLLTSSHGLRHRTDIVAAGSMAGFASTSLRFVARMLEHDLAHHGLAKIMGYPLM